MKMIQIVIKVLITAILGYGIFYVWSKEIDFKAIIQEPFNKIFHLKSKVVYPVFNTGLMNLSMKYKEGLIIEGLTWRKDYQEYKFVFDYSNCSTELTEFSIDIQFPAGVVYYKILQSTGFDNLNVYINQDNMGVANGQEIERLVKYYPNHLFLNALKVYPNSNVIIKLILKPLLDHNNGFVKYDFKFIDEKEHTILNDWIYPMPYTLQNDFVYFNVSKDFIIGKYDYNIKNILEEPLIFTKDGKIK